MKETCPVGGDKAEPVNDNPLVLRIQGKVMTRSFQKVPIAGL
jgi:hypothetical protein